MNKRKLFLSLLVALFFSFTFSSCEPTENEDEIVITEGALILNQGKNESNNASLSYYDYKTGFTASDIFLNKNNRILGDTGQDIIEYGSKLYIAVYGSKVIEVVNKRTAKSIKTFTINNNDIAMSPRALAAANGKVFVTLFDGYVAQIDTATLTVDKTLKVGPNPEGIAVANNKLYVANSGGLQTVKDSTISVIDLATFTETKKIKVNLNPGAVKADSYGDIYVLTKGNYWDIEAKFQHVNTVTDKVTDIDMGAQYIDIVGDKAYIVNFEYAADWSVVNKTVGIYDVKNEKVISANILKSDIQLTPYCINVDPKTNNIYVGETDYVNNGKMNCFDEDGNLKYTFKTGVNPAKIIFIK